MKRPKSGPQKPPEDDMVRPRFRAEYADDEGLVAVGGDLKPATLLEAYRSGVFPWYDEGMPICWWSPDPRAVMELDALHISHRLARTIRSGRFEVTIDKDFEGVIRGCAQRPDEGTWITPAMITAYCRLHDLGFAHSVEVRRNGALVGGLYGVALGGFFAGESMFRRESDASKVALAALVARLSARRFALFDIQFVTPHTSRLGASELPRRDYLQRLKSALTIKSSF